MNLSDSEVATVLAALRSFEDKIATEGIEAVSTMPQFDAGDDLLLDAAEIDDLCERLNLNAVVTVGEPDEAKRFRGKHCMPA